MLHDLALKDPDFDTARAISGESGGDAIIDVGAQRVQRHPAFAVPFDTGDFRAAQAATAGDPHAQRAKAPRGLHRALHHPAERHPALELLGDILGHQLGVDFGLADFDDVEMHFVGGEFLDVGLQLLDIGALLADHHAGTGRVDGDAALLVRTLDHDAAHAGSLELVVEIFADLDVFLQELAILLLARVPARVPGPVDAQTQTGRIDLLTHYAFSFALADFFATDFLAGAFLPEDFLAEAFLAEARASPSSSALGAAFLPFFSASRCSSTTMVIWLKNFSMPPELPRARAWKRFITKFLPTEASRTTRSSTSRSWLFSALAMADCRIFLTSLAMCLG